MPLVTLHVLFTFCLLPAHNTLSNSIILLDIMAAPQPDFQILSNSLIVAGQHVSLLPNLPAINYERFLHEQFATLQERIAEQFRLQRVELDTRFDQIDTRFAQIDTRFAQIDTRFAQIDTRFDQFNMRFMALELSTKAE